MTNLTGWFLNTFDSTTAALSGWAVTSLFLALVFYLVARRVLGVKFKTVSLGWWLLASQSAVIVLGFLAFSLTIAPSLIEPLSMIFYSLFAPVFLLAGLSEKIISLVVFSTLWIVLLLTPVVILAYLLAKKPWQKNAKIQMTQLASFFLPVSVGVVSVVCSSIIYLNLNGECWDRVFSGFHEINAHLKDVCSDDKWQTECPRNKDQLESYNPSVFDDIKSCGSWRYYFDEAGRGTLIVKKGVVYSISDDRFGPERFRHYYSDKMGRDIPLYPPDLPGEW